MQYSSCILLGFVALFIYISDATMNLVIGQKTYSSWSLRAFLALRHCTTDFIETPVLLAGALASDEKKAESEASILMYSPTGKVPCLFDAASLGDQPVYDSLAIISYLHESFPDAKLFPTDKSARAMCLSACCEMHSGFMSLRSNMPHHCVRSGYAHGAVVLGKEDVRADIQRLIELWTELRAKYSAYGPYLFGEFSAADCMFAPVALRFATYDRDLKSLTATAQEYVRTILNNEYVKEWISAARDEGDDSKIAQYEAFCDI
jgi:glutathione S-transferase